MAALLALSSLLVSAMTLLLRYLHEVVQGTQGNFPVRPYGIAYVLIVAGMTVWGGLWIGLFTGVLSLLAVGYLFMLAPPGEANLVMRNTIELVLLGAVSLVVILSIHTAQHQRHRADASLEEAQETQARLLAIVDTAPIGVISCSAEGVLQFANSEAERIWGHGLRPVGMAEWNQYRLLTPNGEPVPPEQTGLARALRGESEVIQGEGIIERADGSRVWYVSRSKVVHGKQGSDPPVLGAVAAFVDVTRQREVEEERERLLQTLLLYRAENVPGMDLAVHYGPAQTEVRVGGDFYDVFPLDKTRTALVIGDMSGKGVPAAAQVAMVRNMLRFALYQGQPLPNTLNSLNDTLFSHHLLQGFATLFVGIYDPVSGGMVYASCGHEPGLLYRGENQIEELMPTGPVLGAFPEAEYGQQTVTLRAGDALALYTDGISEAGRARRDFLGTERLAELLAKNGTGASAPVLLDRIIAGVDAHAPGPLHDDRCLLIAVTHPL